MLAHRIHQNIYLATLFESFQWERVADFELIGFLSHGALPAVKQLAHDSNFLGARFFRSLRV